MNCDVLNAADISKVTTNDFKTAKQIKKLGSGSYGDVFLIRLESGKDFALKETKDVYEVLMIMKLQENKIDCDIIGAKILGTVNQDNYSIAYSLANGDLTKIHSLSILKQLNILIDIAKKVKCLADRGFYYVDLKFPNILYVCKDDNNFDVYLGDLGSIVQQNASGTCTYPPFEYRSTPTQVVGKTSTLVWQLNVLLFQIFAKDNPNITEDDYDLFYWKFMKNAHSIESLIYEIYNLNINDLAFKIIMDTMTDYKTISLETWISKLEILRDIVADNLDNSEMKIDIDDSKMKIDTPQNKDFPKYTATLTRQLEPLPLTRQNAFVGSSTKLTPLPLTRQNAFMGLNPKVRKTNN